MIRTSTLMFSTPPSRMNSRSWMTRSSLAWVSSGMLPISSKKIVPLSASSNSPFFGYTAPVNAPLTWPNRFDSSKSGGRLPELTVMNARSARDEFLAGAALAVDQDRRPRRRRLHDQVEHLAHARAPPDDFPQPVLVRQQVLAQCPVLRDQPPLRQRVPQHHQHFVVLERLGDVVEGAALHRRDGVLDRGEGGDHQHRQVVVYFL